MNSFQDLMDLIQPEQVGRYWFRGNSPTPQIRIFGGQVLAQCLLAANATVDEAFLAHSMHAYFLRAGDPNHPIEFEVDPIRDGRSFATRRVVARQHGQAIFNTSVSYQVQEDGFSHEEAMPDVPWPEGATPEGSHAGESAPRARFPLLDLYQVERYRLSQRTDEPQEPAQQNWYRLCGTLKDDQRLHQAALALISDFSLLGTAFYSLGIKDWEKDYMIASLDHAIWFHAPINLNDYVLYQCDSPWAGNARGFNRGKFWGADGKLIASTTQEGLMRKKTR